MQIVQEIDAVLTLQDEPQELIPVGIGRFASNSPNENRVDQNPGIRIRMLQLIRPDEALTEYDPFVFIMATRTETTPNE
jgi:hypothetical protein